MWEMISGVPAFNDVPHDFNLSLAICKGLRPRVIDDTEPEYVELMKRCWDSDPSKRPTAKELFEYFRNWRKTVPVPENKLSVINYSRTLYTSRKINYSAKLNEILSQELSSRIIMYSYNDDYSDENNSDNYEDLDSCLIDPIYEFRGFII
ncbi:hypothetical protein RirG_269570 [Rhizophagus irregularis DAOM 197198w]|uniref:Serine-threonine/tyrosine-protein kinase catalytic domain-containing protein n=1 Tax=Rhizophagus irregularis (strain DAOM 197198w) TaxID=1432141 RepID=A0A015I9V7_RHIIW|nr:hypothetical protein RirG_269570 [Rhizophagus irregularis DAOM 197198w]